MNETIIGACIGFAGIVVGIVLTAGVEWWRQRATTKKDAIYLATQISPKLERFIIGCGDVTRDDGLMYGELNANNAKEARVSAPMFDPYLQDLNWRSLPPELMDDILNFPLDIEFANSIIASAAEISSGPFYEEVFDERQSQFAKLGIKAIKLMSDLRKEVRLKDREMCDYNSVSYFKEKISEIVSSQKERNARVIPPPDIFLNKNIDNNINP